MADNKVEIIIAARDAASGAINSIVSATRRYHKTLQDLNGTASAVSHTVGRMFLAIGGTALFGKAISAGFKFNSVLEDSRAGIAGLVYSMNDFRDAQGNVAAGSAAWNASMKIAKDIQDDLRVKAVQTAASYEDLILAYNQAYAPGKAAKMNEKQISDVSAAISQAAITLRGPEAARMLGEEMRSVISGQMKSGNTILKPLIEPFLSNEQIRKLGKSGKLYEPLMKAMEGVQKAAGEASKNFSVALSNMKDAASQALGEGMQAGFEKTKSIISDTTNSIMTLDAKTGKITFNPEFLSLIKKAGEYVIYLVDSIIRGVKALNDFRKENPVLVDLIGYFSKLAIGAFAFNAIIRTIGGTWIWMAAQGQANIGMIITLCGNWISVLKTVNIQTIATAGAMTKFGVAAGMAGAYLAGWQIGSWLSKMELGKKTLNEWVQDGISYFTQFLAYIKKVFLSIPAYASYAFSTIGAVLKSPFMSEEEHGKKQLEIEDTLTRALAGVNAAYEAKVAANQKVIRSMYGEVDAGRKVASAADKAKDSMNGLTMQGKKFADDTDKKTAKTKDFTHSLERLADILDNVREKTKEMNYETQKTAASPLAGKVFDVKKDYEKNLAEVDKYIKDASRIVADAQKEGTGTEAATSAQKKQRQIIEEAGRLKIASESKYLASMSRINEEIQKEITDKTQLEYEGRIASEKKWIKETLEGLDALKTAGIVKGEGYDRTKSAIESAGTGTIQKITDEMETARAALQRQIDLTRLDIAEKQMSMPISDIISGRIGIYQGEIAEAEKQLQNAYSKADTTGILEATRRIEELNAKVVELNQSLREQTGSLGEGMAYGMNQWLYNLNTSFQTGVEVAKSTADAMKNAFEDFLFDPLNFSFTDFTNSLRRILAKATTDIIADLIRTGGLYRGIMSLLNIGSSLSSPGSTGAAGAGASAGANFASLFAHSGGIIGRDGIPSYGVSPGLFYNAPRFHRGLQPDEYPAVLQRGEGVFTPGQMKALGAQATGGGNVIVHMNVSAMDSKSFNGMMYENKGALTSMIRAAMKDNHPGRRG